MSTLQTTPVDYLKAANGHRQAAKILEPHIGSIGDYTSNVFLAFYNVLGFAVELYLKAYLAYKDISSDELAHKPYGHNLSALYEAAASRGLFIQRSAMQRIVDILAPNHGDYTYRYLTKGSRLNHFVPGESIRLMFQALDELHANLSRELGQQL